MKIFCSWSGEYSREVASAVGSWIPLVIQQSEVFVSDHSLDPGDRWSNVIADALDEYDFGLIFVSKSNLEKPWLLFEAGALAKSVTKGRIIPMLLNVEPSDLLANPLSQFQSVKLVKDEMLTILRLILRDSPSAVLSQDQLTKTFETWWPDLEATLEDIAPDKPVSKKKATTEDRLEKLERMVMETLREVRSNSIHKAVKPTSVSRWKEAHKLSDPSHSDAAVKSILETLRLNEISKASDQSFADKLKEISRNIYEE